MKLIKKPMTESLPIVDGQNTLIKSGNDYVWRDEKASFVIKDYGGKTNPAWGVISPGFEGLIFTAKNISQVWVDFHIDHDIALNTKIYPHIHWMPLTNNGGSVRWVFQYVIAKGHSQGAFTTAPTTITLDHGFSSGNQYVHMISEVSETDAILSADIEPDSVIKMRIYRQGEADTYNDGVHAWQADLHYQIGRLGTVNKAPNFYGNV